MKDSLQAVQTLTAPNGTKITIWTDGNEKYLSVSVIYKALGYDGRFNLSVLLAMVFKNRSFQIMKKVLSTVPQYVCYLDQIVPILQAFIRLTLISNNSSCRVRDLQDNARAEAERLIEMFNVEVFGKPRSVTVSNITPADEEPTTTTPENNTSTDIAERSLFDESEQTQEPLRKLDVELIGVIQTPNGNISVFKSDDDTLYLKSKELFHALSYSEKTSYKNSYIGKLFFKKNALAQVARVC